MTGVINLLVGQTASLTQNIGSWSVSSGSATLTRTRNQALFSSVDSLAITASATGAVTVRTDMSEIETGYGGAPFRGFAWIRVPAQTQVTASITVSDPDDTTTTTAPSQTILPGKWVLVSVQESVAKTHAGDSIQVRLTISFSSIASNSVAYITGPCVVVPNAVGDNYFGNESYLRLPEYIRAADVQLTQPTAPLFRFIDVLTTDAGQVLDLWNNLQHIPPDDEEGNGSTLHSILVDPDIAPVAWLFWLASLLGVRLIDSSTGYSSWSDLQTAIDANSNGIPSWAEWQTVPDGPDAGTVASWTEIEDLSPDTIGVDVELRWQTETAYFGINAGTWMALKNSCKHFLTGTKSVTIDKRVGGDPWHIRLRTLLAETPGVGAVGDQSNTLLEAIEQAFPVGFRVSHIVD